MTPRLAHGPGAGGQGHADDRRQQLRRQADRERDGEQQRLDHRAVEQQVHRQDEQDDDDHHADQQVAELAHAAREVGLGLARPAAVPRSRRTRSGDRSRRRGPSPCRCAPRRRERRHWSAPRAARPARTIPGCFSTGNDSPVMLASLTRKSSASITRPSAGIRLPAESRMRSPGTIVLTGTVCSTPSRTTRHVSARRRLQLLDRRRRPVLLKEAEQRAAEHDRQDDGRIHPLLQRQRDRGGEDQDEDERALELPQKQAKRAQARRILDAVGTDA